MMIQSECQQMGGFANHAPRPAQSTIQKCRDARIRHKSLYSSLSIFLIRHIFHIFSLLLPIVLLPLPTVIAQQHNADQIIESAIHHQNLGLAYLEESQPSKAIEEFQALVDLVPNEAIGYGNLAVACLRLKKGEEAESWIKRGLEVNPMNSRLHFIRSEIYQWQGRSEEAVAEMGEAVKLAPGDLEARYKLVRYYLGQRNNPEATEQAIAHLQALREQSPTNVVVLLKLAQALLQREQIDPAKQVCLELSALLWDADADALKFLKQGLLLIDQGDAAGAARQIRIFENIQKVSPRYQQGIGELATDILGHPIESFSPGFRSRVEAKLSSPIEVRFVDVTQEIGLDGLEGEQSQIVLTDFDNDGDLDLYLLGHQPEDMHADLFRNESGKFAPVAKIAGYGDAAAFADLDKDGDQDLCVQTDGQVKIFQNDGADKFTELAKATAIHNKSGSGKALFVDYDHDGDLDLFLANHERVEMYRNNADGAFDDVTRQTFLPPDTPGANDAAFGDFDDDGDIDLFVVNSDVGCTLYTNLRQGRMRAITDETGIAQDVPFTAVAVGDYDNDGDLDLFLATKGGVPHQFYRNRGDGTFALDTRSQAPVAATTNGELGLDTHFLDYDNDGFLDLWVIGNRREGDGQGVLLFRNNGTGRFTDASNLLPESVAKGVDGVVGDYDSDGDLDLFLIDAAGRVVVLRNEGGNRNSWLQVRLEGVTAGNNKVNIDGIGSKVEVKVNELYQMKYVTEPIAHFGLGVEKQADVLRVVWTNGVPQNVITPKANQRILEKQVLKGSCPFLYVYDGEKYQFLTDLLWRSPLGMITSGGFPAFADSAADYVKISGDRMEPKAGVYSLQITEELWETAYFDQVKLLAVDHPAGTQIFVDEKFIPPPFPQFQIYTAKEIHHPRAAFDHRGNDVSNALKTHDYHYAIEHKPGAYQGVVEPHFIVLDLGDVPNDQRLTLFLTGWIFPTDTSINVSLSQNPSINPTFPYVQVRDAQGKWQTVIESMGVPAGKNKTIAVDLTGKFLSADRQVKIATNMQIYWDSAFFTIGEPDVPVQVTELLLHRADLHYRGFSEMYRPTPHAPQLFDYEKVTRAQQWRDLKGNYTRYGDVTPLLQHIDDMYTIMNAGDEMTVEFEVNGAPPLKEGWVRDFVLFSDGWVKDGDINTLFSQTVDPLPFHGMSAYPYPEGESYPNDLEHLRYRLKYNTRRVTHDLPALSHVHR